MSGGWGSPLDMPARPVCTSHCEVAPGTTKRCALAMGHRVGGNSGMLHTWIGALSRVAGPPSLVMWDDHGVVHQFVYSPAPEPSPERDERVVSTVSQSARLNAAGWRFLAAALTGLRMHRTAATAMTAAHRAAARAADLETPG